MINQLETIVRVCEEAYLRMIEAVFGKPGVDAAFQVMDTAKLLYKHVELERIDGRVIIYRILQPDAVAPALGKASAAANFAAMANQQNGDLIIEVRPDGQVYSHAGVPVDLEELSRSALVYHWHGGEEEFLAGAQRKTVIKLDQTAHSQFAVPTFPNLREALQNFAVENVRESTCYIFRQVWHGQNRVFFNAKPEATMRNSLTQFLRNRIGGEHDVWPEQNVDERHPVDIRVQPRLSNNRLMLIEIKWLGWSADQDGHITVRYGNRRAQEGADQLAGYLNAQLQSAPSRVIQGYYVIIDGRRDNLSEGMTTICRADGMYYESKDISFNPAHHTVRRDFDVPYRMFARPLCTD